MSSDLCKYPNRCSFLLDSLPDEIQSQILAILPITTLVICKAVSRSWRSLIRSPAFIDSYRPSRDSIFLFYHSGRHRPILSASAYHPSTDSWIDFRFPQLVSVLRTTGTSLLLAECSRVHLYVVDPFSPPHPIHFLPPVIHVYMWYKVLALIEHSPSDYLVVVVSRTGATLHTHIYDSRSGFWEERGQLWIGWEFVDLGNAVYLDGLLFCLSCRPSRLLTFDPAGGQWSVLDLDLPIPYIRGHLLGFGGELYLTAALKEDMDTRIGIWELDRSAVAWKEFDFMPDKFLTKFSEGGLRFLSMVDCSGVICFSSVGLKEIVLCDLAVRRWWCHGLVTSPGRGGVLLDVPLSLISIFSSELMEVSCQFQLKRGPGCCFNSYSFPLRGPSLHLEAQLGCEVYCCFPFLGLLLAVLCANHLMLLGEFD